MQSAQAVFAKVYEQAQGAAGQAGPDMGSRQVQANNAGAGSNPDDDVIDGDFREV